MFELEWLTVLHPLFSSGEIMHFPPAITVISAATSAAAAVMFLLAMIIFLCENAFTISVEERRENSDVCLAMLFASGIFLVGGSYVGFAIITLLVIALLVPVAIILGAACIGIVRTVCGF